MARGRITATVFHLGRTIRELLGEERLTAAQRDLVDAATQVASDLRLPTVEAMISGWRSSSEL